MNHADAQRLIDLVDKQKPLTDECSACGASRRDARLNDFKGCRFCRQNHSEAISSGMGKLSDKYCEPLGDAYLGGGIYRDKDGNEYLGKQLFI